MILWLVHCINISTILKSKGTLFSLTIFSIRPQLNYIAILMFHNKLDNVDVFIKYILFKKKQKCQMLCENQEKYFDIMIRNIKKNKDLIHSIEMLTNWFSTKGILVLINQCHFLSILKLLKATIEFKISILRFCFKDWSCFHSSFCQQWFQSSWATLEYHDVI